MGCGATDPQAPLQSREIRATFPIQRNDLAVQDRRTTAEGGANAAFVGELGKSGGQVVGRSAKELHSGPALPAAPRTPSLQLLVLRW